MQNKESTLRWLNPRLRRSRLMLLYTPETGARHLQPCPGPGPDISVPVPRLRNSTIFAPLAEPLLLVVNPMRNAPASVPSPANNTLSFPTLGPIYDLTTASLTSSTFSGRPFCDCCHMIIREHCTTPTTPRKKLTAARLKTHTRSVSIADHHPPTKKGERKKKRTGSSWA
jgi:hypothetical protein